MAPVRARLLFYRIADLLVAGDSAVAQSLATTALDRSPVSADWRFAEHGAVGNFRFLRSRALSVVRDHAATLRALGTGRPGRCRRDHVGDGLDRVPDTRDLRRGAVSVKPQVFAGGSHQAGVAIAGRGLRSGTQAVVCAANVAKPISYRDRRGNYLRRDFRDGGHLSGDAGVERIGRR